MFKVGDTVIIVNSSSSCHPEYVKEMEDVIGAIFEIERVLEAPAYPGLYWLYGFELPTFGAILSDAVELYAGNSSIPQVARDCELVEEIAATQVQRAEITKGRFITDKEKALIEMRIATRKALRGE